jgi:mRNA interferase YafQ
MARNRISHRSFAPGHLSREHYRFVIQGQGGLMLPVRPTNQFRKDLKRAQRQGRDLEKVRRALEKISVPESLPRQFRDHTLMGEWRDFRECHIEADWLLIYTITDFELRPDRLGTRAELFE